MGPRFWRLLTSSLISNLADGIGRAALPLMAATLTRDPLLISGLAALSYLPWLLFALPAGTFVDRTDRRRAMVGANMVRGAAYAGLAVTVLWATPTIAVLYLVAFVVGIAEIVYDCSAGAMLPKVVRPDQLDRANSLLLGQEIAGQTFIGVLAGAALFSVFLSAPLLGSTSGFVGAALVMLTLPGRYGPPRTARPSVAADIADGVRWLWRQRLLRELAFAYTGTAALQSMVNALLVLYALDVLHAGRSGFATLLAAAGAGGLVGGLVAPMLSARMGRAGALALTAMSYPLTLGAMGLVRSLSAACALYGFSAMVVTVSNVLSVSLRQALVPEHLFGRIQAIFRMQVHGGIPIGSVAGGVLASVTDVPTVFVISGVGSLLVGCWVWRVMYRFGDAAGLRRGAGSAGRVAADVPR